LRIEGNQQSAIDDQQCSEVDVAAAVIQMIAAPEPRKRRRRGGKSELRRAVRRVTPGQGDLKESGTENTQLTVGAP
jgi:hypothetical protein